MADERKWICSCGKDMRYDGVEFNGKLRYVCDKCQYSLVGRPRTDRERLQMVVTKLELDAAVSSSTYWTKGVKWAIERLHEVFPDLIREEEIYQSRPEE